MFDLSLLDDDLFVMFVLVWFNTVKYNLRALIIKLKRTLNTITLLSSLSFIDFDI